MLRRWFGFTLLFGRLLILTVLGRRLKYLIGLYWLKCRMLRIRRLADRRTVWRVGLRLCEAVRRMLLSLLRMFIWRLGIRC